MRHERPTADWPPLQPFWRDLSRLGPRAIALDVPYTFPGEPFNGLEISNWASQYRLCPSYSIPADRMKHIKRRYGKDPMPLEKAGVMSVDELMAIRDELIEVSRVQTRLAEDLLRDEAWDLFLLVYGSVHRGGHHLHSDTSVAGDVPADRRAEYDRSLLDVCRACDEGLGRLLEQVDDDTLVFAFACHGMTDNRSLADLLPEMLRRVVEADDGTAAQEQPQGKPGLTKRLRQAVPLSWRSAVKDRLPTSLQDRLTMFWQSGHADWARTPVFCLLPDLQGHIRVNLAGRERDGIVQPGEEYDRLLDKVTRGLMSFVDEETREPVVASITRSRELYPDGAMTDFLPDLVVDWPYRIAADFRAMVSPRYGRITSNLNGKAPGGRSGHHDFDGWLIAAGPRVPQGATHTGLHSLDLAPALYRLFGHQPPAAMAGHGDPERLLAAIGH